MQRNALRTFIGLFVFVTMLARVQALDVITTVAGDGTHAGFVDLPKGEGGPGPSAEVNTPNFLSVDPKNGSLLISEKRLLRRLNLATGAITTITGIGNNIGFAAEGKPAIDLRAEDSFAGTLGNGTLAIGPLETSGNSEQYFLLEPNALIVASVPDFGVRNYFGSGHVAFNPFSTSQQPDATVEEFFYTEHQGLIYLKKVLRYSALEYSTYTNIQIYAGTGVQGSAGDGGPASQAQIWQPGSMICNLIGDLFFRDAGSNRIRSVDRATQTIRNVFGNGTYSDVFVPGILASNSGLPVDPVFAPDTFGNLYVSDRIGIFKVDSNGLVTLLANESHMTGFAGDGGDAKLAKFRFISSMTCDANGNLYIADVNDHRVRKIAFGPRISSALTANAVQGQPFSYSIAATGSKTITYSTSPAVPGLTLNGNVLSGTPTAAGDYDVTITATNSAAADSKVLKLKVLAVNSPAPPVITSALTATGMVNTAFSYTLTATGAVPITFNATGLPSGLTFAGETLSGTPATAGVFTITLTATNSSATDTQTLTLRIDPHPTVPGGPGTPGPGTGTDPGTGTGPGINLPGAGGSNSVIDSDGDGFSDEMETQLGSDPKNPNSTPLNNKPAGPQSPFDVAKVSIKLNFTSEGKDNLSISGKLPITDGFVVGGQKVITDVGGVIREFQLNDKGQGGPIDNASFKISIRAKKGIVLAQEAKFSIRIGETTVGSTFDDEGFPTRSQTGSVVKPIPVAILFNGVSYRSAESVEYTSRNGKSASIK